MSRSPLDTGLVRWFSEYADQGIFTTDRELIVTSWNRWLERHSGSSAAEVVGRSILDEYPELERRGLGERYREALSGQAYLVSRLLHGHLLPMKTEFADLPFATMPQSGQIAPLFAGGEVIGTITVIDDVSERVASEHELRRQIEAQQTARAAAEAALRVKDEFLATLSHEIRTPLSSVLGWARLLSSRRPDPELMAQGIEVIERNTALQLRMVDDLLDSARVIAGKLRLDLKPIDLAPVALAALEVVAPAAEAKGITVTRRLDPDVARVLADADRMQQVFWNLLSNAVKFTDRGGAIDFRLETAQDVTRITIADTGRGIEPELLPFVFDRFRQSDASGSKRESGLGLGLSLVKELVGLHGGTITASSGGPGVGSTFVVSLPALVAGRADKPANDAIWARRAPGTTTKT